MHREDYGKHRYVKVMHIHVVLDVSHDRFEDVQLERFGFGHHCVVDAI